MMGKELKTKNSVLGQNRTFIEEENIGFRVFFHIIVHSSAPIISKRSIFLN